MQIEFHFQIPNSIFSKQFFSKAKRSLKENRSAYLQYKFLIYVLFGNAGLKFLAFQKSYEKLIYKLQKGKNVLVYDFITPCIFKCFSNFHTK